MADKTGKTPLTPEERESRKQEARQKRLVAAANRAKAVELRKLGMSYEAIGNKLGMTRQSAHAAVTKAMREIREKTETDAETVRTMELEKLDAIEMAMWPGAKNGNHLAADRVLKAMERRAKILGLDAPQKVAPTNPAGDKPYAPREGMTSEERDQRIRELEELEQSEGDGAAE